MTTNATGADKPGSGPEQVARSLPPIPLISPYLALRVGARVLDPTTAPLAPDQTAPSPTVYLADSLLIPSTDPQSLSTTFVALRKHAQDHGICLELESLGRAADPRTLSLARTSQRLRLCSTKRQSAPPIDAWEYLQTALADGVVPMRTQSNADRTSPAVTLEHLLTAAGGAWGATGGAWGATGGAWGATGGAWGATGGAWGATGGAWGATGLAEYGSPGLGGRTPVTWSGRNPRHGMSTTGRPPVVAILDTGIGTSHPWFSDGDGVHRNIAHQGTTPRRPVSSSTPSTAWSTRCAVMARSSQASSGSVVRRLNCSRSRCCSPTAPLARVTSCRPSNSSSPDTWTVRPVLSPTTRLPCSTS